MMHRLLAQAKAKANAIHFDIILIFSDRYC